MKSLIAMIALAIPAAACGPAPLEPADSWDLVVEKDGMIYIADYDLALADCMGVAELIEDVEPFYRGADAIWCELEPTINEFGEI